MATTSTIQKNAEKLKEAGATQQVVDEYIKKATQEQSGGEKAFSVAKDVALAPVKALAAPFAIASEGIKGLTGGKLDLASDPLRRFAFDNAKFGTKEIAGKAVERALDIGAFAVPGGESAKSFGQALKTGAKIGSGFGAGYGFAGSLQDENLTIQSIFADTLLGAVAGGVVGGGLSGGFYGLGELGKGTKKLFKSGTEKVKNTYTEAIQLKNKSQKYSKLINDKNKFTQALDDVADFALDINPTLGEELRYNNSVKKLVKEQLEEGIKPSVKQEKLYEEMVSAIKDLDRGVSKKYGAFEDDLISKFGKESPGSLSDTFLAAVKHWDDGVKIVNKNLSFSGNAKLSQSDKTFLIKLFKDEVANRGNTMQDFLTVSRIMSEGIPFDQTTTKATKNIPKMAYGMMRGKIDDTMSFYGKTGRISAEEANKWSAMNNEYKEFARFKENLTGIIDNINKPANARKLDSILTQLGRTFRSDKPARQKFVKEISDKTGKNFHDAILANEIVRDLSKRKGLAGANNTLSAFMRLFDPGKYSVLAETLEPGAITKVSQQAGSLATKTGQAITSGAKTVVGKTQNNKVNNSVKLLMAMASDETIDRGLRALLILTVKEMLFPAK